MHARRMRSLASCSGDVEARCETASRLAVALPPRGSGRTSVANFNGGQLSTIPAAVEWPDWASRSDYAHPLAASPDVGRSLAFDRRTQMIKRLFDLVVATVSLVTLAPVLIVVAAAIVEDSSGPVLFRQLRVGKYGQPFVMFKFRTMRPDRRKQSSGPPPATGERRQAHKTPNDPRITRVGRFLRRSCLDEVPQLWNVLRGEMSMVGPRPELPEIVARYEVWQHQRHLVQPGITGWWQVKRDGVRPMHEATELDLWYIEHFSVRLDMQILARTLLVAMRGVGAF